MNERRMFPRLGGNMDVSYRVLFREGMDFSEFGHEPEKKGVLRNVSAGGALLHVGGNVKLRSILELKILLPNGAGPMECLAKVLRLERFGEDESEKDRDHYAAVCFLGAGPSGEARLSRYVRKNLN